MPVVSEATSAIDKVALEREEQRIRHIGELRSKDSEILKYVPSIFRFDRAPIEATGISLDSFTRGSVLATHWFIGPVILSLAQHQVRKECTEEVATADFSECEANGRVYGFKPTSLLSNIMVVAGVVGAVLLPIIGAIVDHTPHRKQVAAIAALLLTLSMGLELIIGENTWFAVACLQVVASITYLVLTTAAYAYSSELSDDPDEQTIYQSWFYFFWFISSVLIFGTVAFLHFVFEIKEVNAARIVLTLNLMISVLGFGYAWKYLFQDRPALIKRENDSLLLTGLRHLARSTRHIGSNLPSLRWFLISVIFAEAANNAMATISATYLTDVVKMQPNEIAAVFTLAMLFGMPGAILGKLVSLKHGPLTSAKYCEMCYVVLLLISAVLLTDPSSQKIFAYFYGAFWGVLMGWLHPTLTAIFITIKPPGQDAEMMGVFLFSCYGFAWLPPLTFTLINELGLTAGWALVSLTMFYLLGLVCLYVMGNYAGAIEAVHPHDGRTSSDLAEELPDDEPEENESLIKRLIR